MTPMLHVSDVERGLTFYRDGPGFALVSPESAVREWQWAHSFRPDGAEFSCLDPDGHVLTSGQPTDEPPAPEEHPQTR